MSEKVLRITSKPGHFRAAENERIIARRFSIRKQRSITTFDEEYWEQIRRAIEAVSVGLPSPPTVEWRPRLDLMTWANVDDEMTIVERVSGDISLLRQLTTREVVGVEQHNLTAIIDSLLENEGMRDLLVDRAQELGIKLAGRSANSPTLRINKSGTRFVKGESTTRSIGRCQHATI